MGWCSSSHDIKLFLSRESVGSAWSTYTETHMHHTTKPSDRCAPNTRTHTHSPPHARCTQKNVSLYQHKLIHLPTARTCSLPLSLSGVQTSTRSTVDLVGHCSVLSKPQPCPQPRDGGWWSTLEKGKRSCSPSATTKSPSSRTLRESAAASFPSFGGSRRRQVSQVSESGVSASCYDTVLCIALTHSLSVAIMPVGGCCVGACAGRGQRSILDRP